MPWTKTTPTEEDFSSLQSDIRLMEIAEDPAEFRNFLPGHLQENSSTSETTSFTQPVDRERTEATSSKPRCCESNPPSDELRVLEDDEEYRSMMRRLTDIKCYFLHICQHMQSKISDLILTCGHRGRTECGQGFGKDCENASVV